MAAIYSMWSQLSSSVASVKKSSAALTGRQTGSKSHR